MQAEYYVKVVGGIDVDTNLLTLKKQKVIFLLPLLAL